MGEDEDEDGPGLEVARETFEDRIRALVAGPEPYTAAEIADEMDASRGSVAEALGALADDGVLDSKTVAGDVEVWYRTERSADRSRVRGGAAADRSGSQERAAADEQYRLQGSELAGDLGREATGSGAGGSSAGGPAADERIDAVLADLDVPGTSEMMREWRRDAVAAVVEHLREHGPADAAAIKHSVYPSHAAGYDDADRWWAMVEPRLDSLPGVEGSPDGNWHLDA